MIYVSYSGRRDELRLARRDAKSGTWGPWNPVPGVTGDVWRPSLEFDRTGRLWVVWAQQEPFDAAFDLYARWFDGEHWGRSSVSPRAPEGDFDQQVARARRRHAPPGVAGLPRRSVGHLLLHVSTASSWSRGAASSRTSDANDWAPAIAVDSKGNAHVFWDTYDRGDYDVVGRKVVAGGEPGALVTVARQRLPRGAAVGRGRRARTACGWRTRSATRAGARTTAG